MDIVVVFVGITALYLFLYFLVLSVRSLQTPKKSFFLVSIITLLIFFLIPSFYHANYEFGKAKENIHAEKILSIELEAKLNNALALNDAANKYIEELQEQLDSQRKENDILRKQLNDTIRQTISPEKEHKTEENIMI